jgi:hypothetical protein
LDKHAWALWLLAKNFSFQISSLSDQIAQGRQIIITENPELHLANTSDCVFIKPIPKYLLSYEFWERDLCSNKSIAYAAQGFLRSYLYLIPYKSDFILAKEWRLLPENINYTMFVHFISQIQGVHDGQVSPRHMYGELWATGFWSMLFSYKSGRQRSYLSRLHNLVYKSLGTPPDRSTSNGDDLQQFSLPLENDACRRHYWSLIQKLNTSEFTVFLEIIRGQTWHEREEGRASVIEFLDGERREHTGFKNSREFLAYFADKGDSAQPPSSNQKGSVPVGKQTRRRRLFVIEGLPWNYIGTLGAQLRIFPSIFAAHLGGNFRYSLDAISPSKEKKRQIRLEFINLINVSSLWSSKPGDLPETTVTTSIFRRLRLPGFNEQLGLPHKVAELDGMISFWGRQDDDDGWEGQ